MTVFAQTTIPAGLQRPGMWLMPWVKDRLVEAGWVFVENVPNVPAAAPEIVGVSTGGSTSTLIDSTKAWTSNALTNAYILFVDGANAGVTRAITSNTATQITFSSNVTTVAVGTNYIIYSPVSDILKSPGASNSIGSDFYVSVTCTSGVTQLFLGLSEVWDTNTKKRRKYAPITGTTLIPDTDFSVTDTTGITTFTSGMDSLWMTANVPVSMTYDIDHFVISRLNGPAQSAGNVVYAGVFDSALPATVDPMPICVGRPVSGASISTEGLKCTRDIGANAAASANNWQFYDGAYGETFAYAWPQRDSAFSTDPFTRGSTSNTSVFRFGLTPARTTKNGPYRGVLKSIVVNRQGTVPGDTLAVTMPDGSIKNFVLVQTPALGSSQSAAQVYVPSE